MSTQLAKYEEACRAVTQCARAKEIRDKAIAMAVYARQAKNKDLEIDAELIRCHAERRLGEIIKLQKVTVGLNEGTRRQLVGGSKCEPPSDPRPKLAAAGIDKKLSSHAQAVASIPKDEFDDLTAKRKPKARSSRGQTTGPQGQAQGDRYRGAREGSGTRYRAQVRASASAGALFYCTRRGSW